MKNNLIIRIFAMLAVYFGLTYFGGEVGRIVLYPIRMLVTFLHEFGHAFGALITGGEVRNLQIDSNGGGFCVTAGGNRAIVLMGGYLGSAIFGNLLFYIGTRENNKLSNIAMYVLAGMMIFSSLFWFNSLFTTGLLIVFALVLLLIASKTEFDSEILMFFGLATILYIIQDFNVGPSSDLAEYAKIFVVVPVAFWMYLWLAVAVLLFVYNIRLIFRTGQRSSEGEFREGV